MAEFFSEVFPRAATNFWIVMAAINVLRDEITDHASYEHVRRKVLMSLDARDGNQGGQAVHHDLGERAGILVRDDSCNGPCRRRMPGWERSAALKKISAAVTLERTFPAQRVFQALDRDQTVQRGFAGKQTGFAPVLVVRCVTQEPHSPGAAYECRNAGVRNRVVTADRPWIMRKMQADIAIRHEEPCSQAPGRYEPVSVRETELRRAGPEVALIERQALEQRLPEAGFRVALLLGPGRAQPTGAPCRAGR